jgi:arsenite methyltransferase
MAAFQPSRVLEGAAMSNLTFDASAAKAIEAIYRTPDVVARRARVIDLLAPVPGERLLDVGVGPGLLAEDLARLIGAAGRMVGLDLAPAIVAAASARLAGLPQAEVRIGDAAALDMHDAAFDAAVSTQVYEYVADMPRALSELHRVLRPGGRAVILDTDWRSIVWHSADPARMDRMLACWDDHLADPHLPAKLGPMLRAAGFEVRRVEIVPMFSPRWQPVSYAGGMVRSIRSFVRANGHRFGIDPQEQDAWWAEQ